MNDELLPTSGEFGPDKIHRLPVRVYYEDTDFSGVVYHARYLHFFERGRTDSLRCLGISHTGLATQADPLVVETIYRPQQGARLMLDQVLRRDGDIIATAAVQAVCMDPSGRAKRPPKSMALAWLPYVMAES